MSDRTCLHCGRGGFRNRDALWYHVRRCDKNPSPICGKCGLHFIRARLAFHEENCGKTTERRAAIQAEEPEPESNAATSATAKPAASTAKDPAASLGVPADHLTPTDELILPLVAPAGEKPAPPSTTPKRDPEPRAEAQDADAGGHVDAEAETTNLERKFAERDPPRTAAFAGIAESLKKNWLVLAIIAAVLVVVIFLRRAQGPPQDAAPTAPPGPPPVRPPYNPEVHGSLEQYRQAFGHLPAPGGA